MPYGLDLDEVQYVTDAKGKHQRVQIPVPMFTALTEFWIAARRAQTARIEANARPGQFKGSLQAHVPSGEGERTPTIPEQTATPPAPFSTDRRWQQLLHHMPSFLPEPAETPEGVGSAIPQTPKPRSRSVVRFQARAPADTDYPDSVLHSLIEGKSPMLAWRLHRRMTLTQLAEKYGTKAANLKKMESGRLRKQTIEKLARIFHCTPEQLLVPEGLEVSERSGSPASRIVIRQDMRAHAHGG
jgi:DNA-binding Xre family transcriptional regulator